MEIETKKNIERKKERERDTERERRGKLTKRVMVNECMSEREKKKKKVNASLDHNKGVG
jgi:hypothetical protein